MRRIKTYVMTIGVALSVAPIFNYALAQQGNNATDLLLQVQSMRQEIAELRDMVERQQFGLKRLQQQSDAQSKQFEVARGYGNAAPSTAQQPRYTPPRTQDTRETQESRAWDVTSAPQQPQPSNVLPQLSNGLGSQQVATKQTQKIQISVPQAQVSEPQVALSNQSVVATSAVPTTFITAADVGRAAAQPQVSVNQQLTSQPKQAGPLGTVRALPPVVDRSFSSSAPVVPITGAGSQVSAPSQSVLASQAPNGNLGGGSDVVYSAAALASAANKAALAQNNSAQLVQPAGRLAGNSGNVGIVSIPAANGGFAGQVQNPSNSAQALNQTNNPAVIAAPSSTQQLASTSDVGVLVASGQVTAAQVVQAQISPVAAAVVLSEDDYYAQGFELLKQSQYEQAASIFEQQLSAYPRGDLADDAHYWIAEAMHVSRKLDVAKVHLRAIISDYPQSRRLPDAMLKTAYIEQSQGNQIEARILFQEIVNLHPQSDAAIAAKNQLAAVN